MFFQTGNSCKWTRDARFLILENFNNILNSPYQIYNTALQLCPSSSWLCQCYHKRYSQKIRMVVGPAEWRTYNRTVFCDSGALASKNNMIVVGGNNCITILDATTGSQKATFLGHTGYINALAFSVDGTLLVSGSYDGVINCQENFVF